MTVWWLRLSRSANISSAYETSYFLLRAYLVILAMLLARFRRSSLLVFLGFLCISISIPKWIRWAWSRVGRWRDGQFDYSAGDDCHFASELPKKHDVNRFTILWSQGDRAWQLSPFLSAVTIMGLMARIPSCVYGFCITFKICRNCPCHGRFVRLFR